MQRKFLQEKSLNRAQDNAEKSLNVGLSAKSRIMPYSVAADMLGLNDLYIEERDACENYRMIFTVKPVCTNVIFNSVTEPVYKEGSYSAVTLIESARTPVSIDSEEYFPEGTMSLSGNGVVDQIYAVRNTEFSHERIGDFKYHCGYDIFNNHLLRTNEFEHAALETGQTHLNQKEFNSIFDYAIDYTGAAVNKDIRDAEGPAETEILRTNLRMYQLDNIKSINSAFYDNLRVVDGWYGFYNTGYINIPNGVLRKGKGKEKKENEISVNKILNNEAACSFINLYPDKTLYGFIPKVNRFKKRLERNWDCAIVYPYKTDYDMFNRVMLGFSGTDEEWAAIKEENGEKIPNSVKVFKTNIVYNNVGDEMVEMHTLLRHSLVAGDNVRILYAEKNNDELFGFSEIKRFSVPVRVVKVGDGKGNNLDRCFMIKQTDINTFSEVLEGDNEEKTLIARRKNEEDAPEELLFFYKKIEGGYDDKYYFRKFKEIKNYEYVSCEDVSDAVPVRKSPSVITDESPKYIRLNGLCFEKIERPLTYSQNKIAFAENIYGDRVAQVIFEDDICVSSLKDNIGRPLSTLYFMVEKTNRGHEEWYNSGITSADSIEYSHCFGDITSGLDLPEDKDITDFNVRKLHNIFSAQCDASFSAGLELVMEEIPTGSYSGAPLPIESAITIDGFDDFYGDIVEFSKVNFSEKIIEKVYHRFNTAQRECLTNKLYYDIHYDELVGDIYDVEQQQE